MEINVYSQYFEAEGSFAGVERRSRKREAALLESLRDEIDALAAEHGAAVKWSCPLADARLG